MVSATDISGETCEEVPGIGSGWLLVDGIGNLVELDVLLCVGFDLFLCSVSLTCCHFQAAMDKIIYI